MEVSQFKLYERKYRRCHNIIFGTSTNSITVFTSLLDDKNNYDISQIYYNGTNWTKKYLNIANL